MNILITIFSILIITLIGYLVIRGFHLLENESHTLALALAYGLGTILITMQMYIYTRLHIPWEKELLFYPWILLLLFIAFKKKEYIFQFPKFHKPHWIDVILLIGILHAFNYTVFQALIRPITAWDAWVTWLLKAKVFFIDGGINPEVFHYVLVNYPVVINLLGTFIYIMIGSVDDTAVHLTSTAFYAFTALLLFAVLKPRFGTRYALLFTLLLVTTQNFVRHGGRYEAGLADLPLGYFTFCSAVLFFEYIKSNSTRVFILLNLFIGITGLIKFEGIPVGLVIILFALYHIYKNKLYKHIPIISLWILPIADWELYQRWHRLGDTYASSHGLSVSTEKTVNSISGTLKEMLNIKSWNLLWITYFISLVIFGIKKNFELLVLNVLILSQILLYVFMFVFTHGNNPEGSIERLLMHVAPLVFYYLAIVCKLGKVL